jgi:hypothetical protein
MRFVSLLPIPLVASCAAFAAMAGEASGQDRLTLPAKGLGVDLGSGEVITKGLSGQCLETVSKAGPSTLVVRKSPGDDVPEIIVNGEVRRWADHDKGRARLGSVRLTRDGALVYLRNWKTGDKQTELLQDGQVVQSWRRGISVKLLRLTGHEVFLLEGEPKSPARLVRHRRNTDGRITPDAETVVDFGSCRPDRLRIGDTHVWAEMECGGNSGKGIYKIPVGTGEIGSPLLASPSAEFLSLPKKLRFAEGETVGVVSGTQSAMHFYHAVTGLLLSQTGEVRACSSDAEGLQSWNQSYRVRALATLFAKTGVPVFAELARKSIRLTLAARDDERGRESPTNPGCGWSSLIYGGNEGERLSLMINQAMIANSLNAACRDLDGQCPGTMRDRIGAGALCLAQSFANQFDPQVGLYRIRKDIGFRFAGNIAPWNWQISFAELLHDLPGLEYRKRARDMANGFLREWQIGDEGALWRYWPRAYYSEKGLRDSEIETQRYEDTGHAGISLLSLREIAPEHGDDIVRPVQKRLDSLLSFGFETPRDLDGKGPRATRWFPAGGWADYGSERFRDILSGPIPGRFSADSVYGFSRLFEPDEAFQLKLDVYTCADECFLTTRYSYNDWRSFLENNPLFTLRQE